MSAPKFTPGPWQWDEIGYSLRPATVTTDVTCIIELEARGMVARPQSRGWQDIKREINANMTLLAAAPEMHAALVEVRRAGMHVSNRVLNIVDAALDKADCHD